MKRRRPRSNSDPNLANRRFDETETELAALRVENHLLKCQLQELSEATKELRKVWKCAICFDEFLPDNLYILDKCNHKYCTKCLSAYVDSMVMDAQTTVSCPHCKQPMEHHELMQLMNPAYRERYEKFCLDFALSTMNDVVNCPTANCGNAFIRDPATRDIHCLSCDARFCTDCKRLPHPDIVNCAEVEQILKSREERASESWISGYSKQCPKCHSPIQKISGCNHMTCAKCHHNFCWICLGNYVPGHFDGGRCRQYDGGDSDDDDGSD